MAEEDSPSMSATGKSKQERIRDNQRRSRARRQEYLADLERRLSDCHITCREADLQRDVFSQLQQENARLRELLVYAGISPDLVESYVTRDAALATQDPNQSLRQIKPKVSFAASNIDTNTAAISSCGPRGCDSRKPSSANPATAAQVTPLFDPTTTTIGLNDPTYSSLSRTTSISTSVPQYSPSAQNFALTDLQSNTFDWLFDQQPGDNQNDSIFPDTFGLNTYNSNLPGSQNTILYSVAKDLINQFEVTPHEMENIKARLQVHFSRPSGTNSGQDEVVNQQILFHILNELSTKHN